MQLLGKGYKSIFTTIEVQRSTFMLVCVSRHIESSFHQCGSAVKLMQASLGVRKDVECNF